MTDELKKKLADEDFGTMLLREGVILTIKTIKAKTNQKSLSDMMSMDGIEVGISINGTSLGVAQFPRDVLVIKVADTQKRSN